MAVETVLVTGAFGLVGAATMRELHKRGASVVATDLETSANRRAARRLPSGVDVRWADLTDESAVNTLLAQVAPTAIIHLAAVIPTACYQNANLARRVNVEATRSLVTAAERSTTRPRFVTASSVAVHGSRNPHKASLLHADSPLSRSSATPIWIGRSCDWARS